MSGLRFSCGQVQPDVQLVAEGIVDEWCGQKLRLVELVDPKI